MNHFKESLQYTTTKEIDEKISNHIKAELKQLEEKTQKEEYKQQIEQRSTGIQQLLVDFDYDMEIVDRASFYKVLPSMPLTIDIEKSIDHIIARTISRRLESMYKETMENGEEDGKDKQLEQILNRKRRIERLLEQYRQNMALIEKYRKREQLSQEKSFDKGI